MFPNILHTYAHRWLGSILLLLAGPLGAQTHGQLTDAHTQEPVPYATLQWQDGSQAALTDELGHFRLDAPARGYPAVLIVRHLAYQTDSIPVAQAGAFALRMRPASVEYDDQTITHERKGTYLDALATQHTEIIGEHELTRAACCNLAESFETNASVDVNYTDAVTGTRDIMLLGLSGLYAQLSLDNQPLFRGLGRPWGLDLLPGTWLQSIAISKGNGPVSTGFESLTGELNICLLGPETGPRNLVNLYVNETGRTEANLALRRDVGPTWRTRLLVHGSTQPARIDRNQDGFLDQPVKHTLAAANRWEMNTPRRHLELHAAGYWQDRQGGQLTARGQRPEQHTQGNGHTGHPDSLRPVGPYNVQLGLRRVELAAKTGFLWPEKPYQSIGIQYAAVWHEQDGLFGLRQYYGRQQMARVNALFSSILGTTWHSYRVGLSYLGDDTREQFDGIGYHLPQHIPGAFAEYIFQPNDDFTLQAGLRGDWHSRYGSQVSPRLHLRYRLFDDRSTLRLSAGRGWRVPALLAENTASMASNRAFALTETIRPEASWNLGAGWVQLLPLGSRTLRWTTDYYYTWFTNQLIVDRDQSPNLLVLSNLRGQSYAHSLQTELSIELLEGLTARGAWRWYDVRLPLAGRLQWAPMIAAHRALATVGYEIAAWQFDLTANWVGTQRLPSTASSPEIHRRPGQSPSYWNLHAQVTWRSPKWDVYLGGENLTNFRMSEPIMAANDPFGPHFDAAMVWGPILGRVVYAGMRWRPDW